MMEQVTYKVILIGDCRVGKTSYLNAVIGRTTYFKGEIPPTIGVQYAPTKIKLPHYNKVVNTNIWDTCTFNHIIAGAEKYKSITSSYYRKCQGVIMMFDVTDRKTFLHLRDWLEQVNKRAKGRLIILVVGNKIDLVQSGEKERQVSQKQITDFCVDNSLNYELASVLSGYNIVQSFANLIEKIFEDESVGKFQIHEQSQSHINNLSLLSDKNKQPRKQNQTSQCSKCC